MRMPLLTWKCCVVLALGLAAVFAEAGYGDADLSAQWVRVKNMTYDSNFWIGDELVIDADVVNEGNEGSGSYTVEYYLSKDSVITTSDYYLTAVHRGDLDPGAEDTFSTTCTIPMSIPGALYSLGILVVCSNDSHPENNTHCAYSGIVVRVPVPDLAIQYVHVTNGCARPGGTIRMMTEVKNVGQKASASYVVEYYAGGYKVGDADRAGLAPGMFDTFEAECTVPAGIPHANYQIVAKIVCSDDSNSKNDEASDGATVWMGPFADLAIQSVDVVGGSHVPDSQVVVHSLLQNVGDKDAGDFTVQFYLSKDDTITTKDYCIGSAHGGQLRPGGQSACDTTCRLPPYFPEGSCYVGAVLTCQNDGYAGNNQAVDDTPITIVHAHGYVCGRIVYKDLESWEHPVRYALVKVYDADDNNNPLDDRVIGETSTDQNGNYGVLILADSRSGQRVYIKAFTQVAAGVYAGTTSTICSVRDDVLHEVYSLKSSLYPHPRDASLTANMTALPGGEFIVYDSVVEGFHKARTFFGIEPNEITTYWPTSDNGTYYDPNSGIHIAQEDRGDRDVIMHEYGHYVAQLGNFAQGDVGAHPMHYWRIDLRYSPSNRTEEHARNLAFREAWATLFSIATQRGDVWYPYSGDDKYHDYDEKLRTRFTVDLEKETRYHKQPGEFYENMNACALWDIFDDNCDGEDDKDTLSDTSLAKMWTALLESRPEDIKDFWNGWFERYTYIKEMMRIFKDHGMPFKYLGPSPTVEGFETSDFKAFAWTHPSDIRWAVTSDQKHQGGYSAKAGRLGHGQASILEISITCDEGWIRFWHKVSSEEGFDKLQFFLDGDKWALVE